MEDQKLLERLHYLSREFSFGRMSMKGYEEQLFETVYSWYRDENGESDYLNDRTEK